ncbi:MAG: tetratricopeptide repeat protein [Acidobacteria bacterium]|nr:tetratricopeptide repeat protein [Acidobacteriota bacterium]
MKRIHLFPALALSAAILLAAGCEKQVNFFKARSELNKGVTSFTAADYTTAAQRFETALELDPNLTDARNYRAYAYMMQFIPGDESAENKKMADEAISGFKEVLDSNPDNELAVGALASLYFNMKDFKEAEKWHRRRIEILEAKAAKSPDGVVDPLAAESYYTIGVIKWTQAYEPRLKVRADLGMKPEDPGPIKDEKARKELAATSIPIIDDGIQALTNALKVNPDYADAMAYLNLLNRERADLADSPEEYEQYLAKADEWVQKTLATKKRLAEESTTDQFHAGE